MIKHYLRALLATLAGAATLALPLAAVDAKTKAGSQVFEGLVEHVSTSNLKVVNPKTKQTLSFLLVPHFGKIFKKNNTTTAQQKELAEGAYIKVYFDQKALGIRHADRILILNDANVAMKKMKS